MQSGVKSVLLPGGDPEAPSTLLCEFDTEPRYPSIIIEVIIETLSLVQSCRHQDLKRLLSCRHQLIYDGIIPTACNSLINNKNSSQQPSLFDAPALHDVNRVCAGVVQLVVISFGEKKKKRNFFKYVKENKQQSSQWNSTVCVRVTTCGVCVCDNVFHSGIQKCVCVCVTTCV